MPRTYLGEDLPAGCSVEVGRRRIRKRLGVWWPPPPPRQRLMIAAGARWMAGSSVVAPATIESVKAKLLSVMQPGERLYLVTWSEHRPGSWLCSLVAGPKRQGLTPHLDAPRLYRSFGVPPPEFSGTPSRSRDRAYQRLRRYSRG